MTDRLRCAGCEGHVAYECDRRFEEEVGLTFLHEILEERPRRTISEGKIQMLTPGSAEAMKHALMSRSWHIDELHDDLQEEWDCGLTAEQVRLALYQVVEEFREEHSERVDDYKSGLRESIDELFRRDK